MGGEGGDGGREGESRVGFQLERGAGEGRWGSGVHTSCLTVITKNRFVSSKGRVPDLPTWPRPLSGCPPGGFGSREGICTWGQGWAAGEGGEGGGGMSRSVLWRPRRLVLCSCATWGPGLAPPTHTEPQERRRDSLPSSSWGPAEGLARQTQAWPGARVSPQDHAPAPGRRGGGRRGGALHRPVPFPAGPTVYRHGRRRQGHSSHHQRRGSRDAHSSHVSR